MFIRIFELCLLIFFFAATVSQIIIPLWRGTQLFPFFRKEREIVNEIEEARQAEVERELRKKLDEIKRIDVPAAKSWEP